MNNFEKGDIVEYQDEKIHHIVEYIEENPKHLGVCFIGKVIYSTSPALGKDYVHDTFKTSMFKISTTKNLVGIIKQIASNLLEMEEKCKNLK